MKTLFRQCVSSLFLVFSVLVAGVRCSSAPHGQANEHMHAHSFEELVANFDDPERSRWQKPDDIIRMLGPLKGKTVFEIGSGTGYFTFRLEKAGARVVCGDVDQRFLDLIGARMKERGIAANHIELRRIPFDSPAIAPGEVDLVLTVDTYHHIENRAAYFREVLRGLRPGGRLVVIDFKKESGPHGPPASLRVAAAIVQAELREAGFDLVDADSVLLPYQFVVTASKK